MKKPILLITIFLLFNLFSSNAQDYKFGKVSEEELSEKYYPQDSSAVAAVLYREYKVRYEYSQSQGFKVVTDVHERIKIYKKDGFSYATITEHLYLSDTNGDRESLGGLKAYTYNLVDGKIEETKLKGSDTFTEEVSKSYKAEKFTLPNVKEGSVIEYLYSMDSPFAYNIDEIILQYDIPIKKEDVAIEVPEYFVFNPKIKGYLMVVPKTSRKPGKITFQNKSRTGGGMSSTVSTNYTSNSIDFITNVSEFNLSDVPALKEEKYVNNINNYRSSVNYELQYTHYPEQPIKSYSTTWEKVVETIYDSPNFGKQIESTRHFKDELPGIIANATSPTEKMNAIFFYVQQNMNWNNYYGKYTDQGLKDALKEKIGNVADINLLLVAMMKEAGLNAYPVLVSTRDNGVPLFPTREGFNYVIASVEIDNSIILLDATNKYAEPNLIPNRALNWYGRLIKEDKSSISIPLNANMQSQEAHMIQATMEANGNVSGLMRTIHSDYYAYNFRNSYNGISESDYLSKLENKHNSMEIDNYTIENKSDLGKSITEKFEFSLENQADVIGDKIYFSPTLFLTTKENPFKLEERNYPIDFGYPWTEKLIISVKIPDGYKIESTPEPLAASLPNDIGAFKYIISNDDKEIKIMVSTEMKTSVIGIQDYAALKEFYRILVEKETEKVVLSKM